jgi:hypothetical protein
MARASDGSIVDPFGGQADLQSMTLRFVGEPMDRIREDGLRTVRAFRFAVTKGMTIESRTWDAITSKEAADKLASVSKERMRDELEKMLREDTLGTMSLLAKLPDWTVKAMFPNGLRLSATLKKSSAVEIKERKWTDDLGGMSENSETSPEQPVLSPIATELQKLWQDGFAAGMADPMIKLVKAEVDQNDIIDEATAYARKSAGEMVEGVKNTRPIQSLISRSIDEEWTDARLQKALSRIVGLDTRSQVALDNLEKKLTKDGLPVGKRNKQVDAYSKTLKARRVKVIADNERASAFAEGKRAAWRRMKSMDEISPYAVRIWRTHKDEKTCSVCGPLNGRRAGIDDNRGYRTGSANKPTGFTLGPPAHVNCRCWEELTDRGTPKVP